MSFTDEWEKWGGPSFDGLAAALADTDAEYAALDARYGPGGTHDAQRKAFRSVHEIALRESWSETWGKMTEAAVEARAAAHPEVRAWLDRAEAERTRYALLTAEREAIRERMRYLRGVVFAAAAEARLAA